MQGQSMNLKWAFHLLRTLMTTQIHKINTLSATLKQDGLSSELVKYDITPTNLAQNTAKASKNKEY